MDTGDAGERARTAAETPDRLRVLIRCRRCASATGGSGTIPVEERTLDEAPYRSFDELVAHARALAVALFARPAPLCPRGHAATRTMVELISMMTRSPRTSSTPRAASTSPASGELIIRVRRRWHGADVEVPRLRPEDRAAVARDALLRAAHLAVAHAGANGAAPLIADAAQILAGDAELLAFVTPLVAAHRFDLAESIAAAHLMRVPRDADGLYAMAAATVAGVEAGHHPEALLLRATLHLEEALRRRPGFADAEALLQRVTRMRAQLAGDPAAALAEAERALAHLGEDAGLHLARARALVALGRAREAQRAVAEARALSPRHPDLGELTLAVARARIERPDGDGAPTLVDRKP